MSSPPRTLERVLGRHQKMTADIEHWQYVRPYGARGLHVVRRVGGSSAERIVGSSLGGQTFTPGSLVPIGLHGGTEERFIIGVPPPGKRGASFNDNQDAGGSTGPSVVRQLWAFRDENPTVLAWTYAGANWSNTRSSKSISASIRPQPASACCIGRDPLAHVGDGSLAWRSATNQITVWDVAANTVYTYTAALYDAVTHPLYAAGALYWIEHTPPTIGGGGTMYYALRSAPGTLAGVQTVGSSSFTVPFSFANINALASALNSNAYRCVIDADDGVETAYSLGLRITLGGSTTEWEQGSEGNAWAGAAPPGVVGKSFIDGAEIDDSVTPGEGVQRWPTSGDWDLTFGVYNSSVLADGSLALVYGQSSTPTERAVIAPPSATSGNPTEFYDLTDVGGNYPHLVYLAEA